MSRGSPAASCLERLPQPAQRARDDLLHVVELTGLTLANVQQIISRSLRKLREALEA